jgi:uncharacterized protein YlxW (UPF0749 family)
MEYTSGAISWRRALRRAVRALGIRPRRDRRRGWALVVPVVTGAAGLLFATTATSARGTDLRDDRRPELTGLIAERRNEVNTAEQTAARLRESNDKQAAALAGSDSSIAAQLNRVAANASPAGQTAVRGPGVSVRLDDAPRRPDGMLPAGAHPDDLVVHQQDVQAVVNALWTGGAEAMTIMGVRVISTSAVRCVGNTLLLHGRVYSPPFMIHAIGDQTAMRAALDADEGVRLFRDAAAAYGLGYQVKKEDEIQMAGYDGSTDLQFASVP